MSINIGELLAFIFYFACMLGIGFVFMKKMTNGSDSDYYLGNRSLGPWVTGLSAEASDMSGWLLMGFPGSLLVAGFVNLDCNRTRNRFLLKLADYCKTSSVFFSGRERFYHHSAVSEQPV